MASSVFIGGGASDPDPVFDTVTTDQVIFDGGATITGGAGAVSVQASGTGTITLGVPFDTSAWRVIATGNLVSVGNYNIGNASNSKPDIVYVQSDVIVNGKSVSFGVAAGYKIARGSTALDGSNPTPVSTGLTTVVSFVANLRRNTALSTGTAFVTHDAPSGANVDVYGWAVAGTASTGTETFDWIAVGT